SWRPLGDTCEWPRYRPYRPQPWYGGAVPRVAFPFPLNVPLADQALNVDHFRVKASPVSAPIWRGDGGGAPDRDIIRRFENRLYNRGLTCCRHYFQRDVIPLLQLSLLWRTVPSSKVSPSAPMVIASPRSSSTPP